MEWIIWTIGWWAVITFTGFIVHYEEYKFNRKATNEAQLIEGIVLLIIWIIGMVKFW